MAEKIERLAIIDTADNCILSLVKSSYVANHIPDAIADTRVIRIPSRMSLPDDVTSQFYVYLFSADELPEIKKLHESCITAEKEARRGSVDFTAEAFHRLIKCVRYAQRRFKYVSEFDPMIQEEIRGELIEFRSGRPVSGFIERYANVHQISSEAAFYELNLEYETRKVGLERITELFWIFKKRICDSPPKSELDVAALVRAMRAEFVLNYKI